MLPVHSLGALPVSSHSILSIASHQGPDARLMVIAATAKEIFGWHPAAAEPQVEFRWEITPYLLNIPIQVVDDWLVYHATHAVHGYNLLNGELREIYLEKDFPKDSSVKMRIAKRSDQRRDLIMQACRAGAMVVHLDEQMNEIARTQLAQLKDLLENILPLSNQEKVASVSQMFQFPGECIGYQLAVTDIRDPSRLWTREKKNASTWDQVWKTPQLAMSVDGDRLICAASNQRGEIDVRSYSVQDDSCLQELPGVITLQKMSPLSSSSRFFDLIALEGHAIGIFIRASRALHVLSLLTSSEIVKVEFPLSAAAPCPQQCSSPAITYTPPGLVLIADPVDGKLFGWSLGEHLLIEEASTVQTTLKTLTSTLLEATERPETILPLQMLRHVLLEHTLLLLRRLRTRLGVSSA